MPISVILNRELVSGVPQTKKCWETLAYLISFFNAADKNMHIVNNLRNLFKKTGCSKLLRDPYN